MKQNKSDFLDIIHRRKSVRSFSGEDVSNQDITELLKAGMAAPSAVNFQPWEFLVVKEKSMLGRLGKALPYAKMLFKAGAGIVVCAESSKAYNGMEEFAIIDASLATENILLAAEALGLGALWTALYPEEDRMKTVRDALHIPESIIPLNLVPVGHPTGEDRAKDKFKEEKIHWETW